MDALKNILENAVQVHRFNINTCINIEGNLCSSEESLCASMKNMFTEHEYIALKRSLIRNSFLVELVNDEVTSTKVECRWSPRLAGECRYAQFDSCYEIFKKLLEIISGLNAEEIGILKDFLNYSLISYELPIDYTTPRDNNIHAADNVNLFLNDSVLKTIKLRKLIFTGRDPIYSVFKRILTDKITVKTYLTDRAQTGDYKTNREKRWEAHPRSVQYALRRKCFEIETVLLLQAARFQNCDNQFVSLLKTSGLLEDNFEFRRCPITGEIINFDDFSADVLHPIHGKSKFQVGHLNPLKATSQDGISGHSAQNISWISENGNRIQGSLSIKEVDRLLKNIYRNRPELHV